MCLQSDEMASSAVLWTPLVHTTRSETIARSKNLGLARCCSTDAGRGAGAQKGKDSCLESYATTHFCVCYTIP